MPPTGVLLAWDLSWGATALLAGFFILAYRDPGTPRIRTILDRTLVPGLRRVGVLSWDWRQFTIVAAVVVSAGAFLQTGRFTCGTGTDDVGAYLASGKAALSGGNPFLVASCGGSQQIPYGLAAVGLNALGSIGGRAGIWAVWLAVALLLIPLVWWLAEGDRRYVTMYVLSSILFIPIVSGQIDGASNASVPVGLLLSLALSGSAGIAGAVVAGVMASIRFPLLVPYWSASASRGLRGIAVGAISATTFGACMIAAVALWGSSYLQIAVLGQLSRESFSLNEFGFLFPNHWVTPSPWLTGIQLGAILLTLVYLSIRPRAVLTSAGIGLVVVALVTQYLSFNFLLWLIPVALLGHSARRWLYAIGFVGGLNLSLTNGGLKSPGGIQWPSEVLSALMVVLLAGLLLTLIRSRGAAWSPVARPVVPDKLSPSGSHDELPSVPSGAIGVTED